MARIETIRNAQSIVINVPGQPSIEVDIRRLSADIVRRLTLHGLAQKIGDAAAKERDPVTGKSATWAVKHASMRRIADALLAGEWSVKAERTPPDAITPDRVEAVARARGTDVATIDRWLNGLTPERRTAVFGHASVQVELARMRAERIAAANPDPDADPFAGLHDDDTPDAGDDDDDVNDD